MRNPKEGWKDKRNRKIGGMGEAKNKQVEMKTKNKE